MKSVKVSIVSNIVHAMEKILYRKLTKDEKEVIKNMVSDKDCEHIMEQKIREFELKFGKGNE